MKKVIYLLLFILLLIPIKISANGPYIKSARIEGSQYVTAGQSFILSFHEDFENIKKNTTDTYGVWLAGFEIEYDSNIVKIEGVYENGKEWDTTLYTDGSKVFAISEFVNDPYKNACIDNILYCSDYVVTIAFKVINESIEYTDITMSDINAFIFKVKEGENIEYYTEDMMGMPYTDSNITKKIYIEKAKTPLPIDGTTSEDVIKTEKPITETPSTNISSNTTPNNSENITYERKKSDNNYLRKLVVKGSDLSFKRNTLEYIVNISENINAVEIIAATDDEKASYEVIGADNIKENDYIVTVRVKAENSNIQDYTIKLVPTKEKIKISTIDKIKKYIKKLPLKMIAIIGGGIIILIILIIIICNIVSNRKLDKKLEI